MRFSFFFLLKIGGITAIGFIPFFLNFDYYINSFDYGTNC